MVRKCIIKSSNVELSGNNISYSAAPNSNVANCYVMQNMGNQNGEDKLQEKNKLQVVCYYYYYCTVK
jgi:hypothetical protein